jgi:glycosyltransferase involved in cell wall biosynthesis
LPVRDGERFLREALASVFDQTLGAFELVVVDDGSTDSTPEILAGSNDTRLRVLRQERDGLVGALNLGISAARASYIARMDADDVSLPARLERQLDVLEAQPQVGLVGCGIEAIDADGVPLRSWLLPADDAALRRRLLLRNPFAHGSVMIRREALARAGGYRAGYGANEDYDLWRRIAREWRLAAVPAVLYRYREHEAGVTKAAVGERVEARERLRDELWREPALLRAIGGEGDRGEKRALAREALRRRRYLAAVRATLS